MATPVFFMHDGAVDELICIPLLQSMQSIEISAVWITPADCLALPTVGVCEQLFDLIGIPLVPLLVSDSSSERPFPWTYRQYALMVNLLPILRSSPTKQKRHTRIRTRQRPEEQARSVYEHIKRQNDQAGEATIFLVTCPLTDFAWLMDSSSGIQDEVASLTWMGGTLNAGGNIDTGLAIGANPQAEWNAYWDPFAVDSVLKSGITINMFPLDVTNSFALTTEILEQYFIPRAPSYKYMDLACQLYALVAFQAGFCFWDTAAAASLGNDQLFTMTPTTLTINTQEYEPDVFGCFTKTSNGSPVNIASLAGSVADFYEYLTQQLQSLG